jgi:F-box/leucine-rich repeat protein 2/20
MWNIINPTRPLTDFFFFSITRVGDEALVAIGQGCSLQQLNVSGCHQIGDAGIIAIARGCPQLIFLDVSVLQVCSLSLPLLLVYASPSA